MNSTDDLGEALTETVPAPPEDATAGTTESEVEPTETEADPTGTEGDPTGTEGDSTWTEVEPAESDLDPAETEVDRGAVEAILLVTDEPLHVALLAQVLERPVPMVEATLAELAEEYDRDHRGFELRAVAGGWRLYTREEYAEVVERFVLDGQQAKLTQAALETLAVVAYRQPVSRARVSAIRGVNCDGVMKTLGSRALVEEAGTDHESGATLFRTTSYFLERLGLGSLEELPDLAPYLPDIDDVDDLVEGTTLASSEPAEAAEQSEPSEPAEAAEQSEPDAPDATDASHSTAESDEPDASDVSDASDQEPPAPDEPGTAS